jgi:hypothetical protein
MTVIVRRVAFGGRPRLIDEAFGHARVDVAAKRPPHLFLLTQLADHARWTYGYPPDARWPGLERRGRGATTGRTKILISRGVFMRPANLMVVTASAAAFGLVSFGQALVVIGGGFDLAVGSLVAMSISAIVFFRSDFGIVGGTVAALDGVTVAGLISGIFVSRTKIPPFIVTLGMLSVADSMSWILAAGQPITVPEYDDAISPLFASFPLGQNVFPIITLIIGFVATSLLLHRSKWGR